MSTTKVMIRVPDEVLSRIDTKVAVTGETRTEHILRWLPEYYDDNWTPPPAEPVKATDTTIVTLRIDNDILARIDSTALRNGLTRTDAILRWQPSYFTGKADTTSADETDNTRELVAR
jgi:hypothetical protein